MKPTEPNIKWCLQNRDLVARWLERRGGWQRGDWVWLPIVSGGLWICSVDHGSYDEDATWLPSVEDVIEMLVDHGVHPELLCTTKFRRGIVWLATNYVFMVPIPEECYETPLIALMELLKASEIGGDHVD